MIREEGNRRSSEKKLMGQFMKKNCMRQIRQNL